MSRYLIATDGSPGADDAIRAGLELAAEDRAAVTFLHVAPELEAGSQPPSAGEAELDEVLERAGALARAKGVPFALALERGSPAARIMSYAEEIGASLVVVGSRGLGAKAGAELGSVSRAVLSGSDRQVLVVRGRHSEGGEPPGETSEDGPWT